MPSVNRKAARLSTVSAVQKQLLPLLISEQNLPQPIPEFRFHPTRRWLFDYAWPDQKIALEIEGGVWIGGRHNRGAGFLKDMEKYNAAAILGWRLIRATPSMIASGEAVALIQQIFDNEY